MRARSASAFEFLRLGWLQAGFGSFAYRLAHFQMQRSIVIAAVSALFYFA